MKISKMANAITPSLTRKLFNMANEIGSDVINLTLGDPDILPPEEIREAACEAVMSGKTRYSANAGLVELRNSYSDFFKRTYGITIQPQKNIIATVGGMEALFLALATLVDEGDEVIVLAPYYVNYVQMIKMLGGKPIIVDGFDGPSQVIAQEIEKSITDKTIAIIINSPCNPTGAIMDSSLLEYIAEIAVKRNLIVISDEVYNSLIYDGEKADSIILRKGMVERTVVIDSCSKRFAMTGWRIGFATGPEEIISNMTKMQENVAACAPVVSQYAAAKAYKEDFDYSYINKIYSKRRDIVYEGICSVPLLQCKKPKATFYCFVDISKTGMNAEEFAYALLESKHVAVVPGSAYGEKYSNYIRIAFTLNETLLKEAMQRIQSFCEELNT